MSENKLQKFLKIPVELGKPKVSIYLPTHRTRPQTEGDQIQFKNLMNEAREQLETHYSSDQYESILKSLELVHQETVGFWQYNKEGLILFAWEDKVEYFRLRQSVEPEVIVGDYFHLLPLFAYYIDTEPAILASISRDRIHLYQVDRFSYEEIQPEHIHLRFNELYDDFDGVSDLSYSAPRGGTSSSFFHGFRSKPEEVERDREKYFRYVNDELVKLAKEVDQPVIIAGRTENVGQFQKIAKSDVYYDKTINHAVEDFSEAQFKEALQDFFDETYEDQMSRIHRKIAQAHKNDRVETRPVRIEEAAKNYQVDELFVDYSQVDPTDTRLDASVAELIQQARPIKVLNEGEEVLESAFLAILRS